jgi:RHS repeat-associated protein
MNRRGHEVTLDVRRYRRSLSFRALTGLAIGATFLGPLHLAALASTSAPASAGALPDDRAVRSSDRIRPIAIEDVAGRMGPDALWRLFDGDASTGLEVWAPTKIRLTFAGPVTVDAIGGYDVRGGAVTVLGAQASDAPQAVIKAADGRTSEPRWARVPIKAAASTRTFVFEWAPGKPGALLRELEVWGRADGTGASFPDGDDALADGLHSGLPPGALVSSAREAERTVAASAVASARTFSVPLATDPRGVDRAFLLYELGGLPHFTAARRAINGGPAVGGFGVARGAVGGLQVEEIAPGALRAGVNTFRFEPSPADDPVGYRVSKLRVVTTTGSAARGASGGDDLTDGREATGWDSRKEPIRRWQFDQPTQPRELGFRLLRAQGGALVVTGGKGLSREHVSIDLRGLKAGWHRVVLDALPPVESLSATIEGAGEIGVFLSEASLTGSPLPGARRSALRVAYPLHGECVDRQVYVRALFAGDVDSVTANGSPAPRFSREPGGFNFTATEAQLGGGGGKPFAFALEARGRSGAPARTEIKIGGCAEPAKVALRTPAGPVPDVGAPYGVTVSSAKGAELSFAGAALSVPTGAVDADVRLTMRPLRPRDVPPLDAGMTNVTAGGQAFRFGPHGMTFKKPVALKLPIDRTRLDPGEQPRTFYYDETERRWRAVELLAVNAKDVVAETTHFTDFITATMTLPEHPGLQSLNPTSLKNIQLADPAAGVTSMAPPQPNSKGTANLSYPIEVPPGRRGVQPDLAIAYDSSAGNGWLGTGWNLTVSSIEIDTRFGVPKYDGTERYLLDGEALTQLSTTPPLAPAGTYFARRREGSFDWIQRLGSTSAGFTWLVTDKSGTKYFYGTASSSRLADNGSAKRVFRWCLEKVEDIWGNQILYTYSTVSGTLGSTATKDTFQQVYPSTIQYTATKTGAIAPQYKVTFNRKAGRGDSFSTGRAGFLVLTDQLLDNIVVENGTSIVRKYVLKYSPHEFGKTLLDSVELFGQGGAGTVLAKHAMTYTPMPKGTDQNPQYFAAPTLFSADKGNAGTEATTTSLRDSNTTSISHDTAIALPFPGSVGVGASVAAVVTRGKRARVDVDGDGLPDQLPDEGPGPDSNSDGVPDDAAFGMQQQLSVNSSSPPDPAVHQGFPVKRPFPEWFSPYDGELNTHLSSHYNFILSSNSEDYGNISESAGMVADINGDGLPDRVYRSSIMGLVGLPGALDTIANVAGIDQTLDKVTVHLNKGKFQGFTTPTSPFAGYTGLASRFNCLDILKPTASPLTLGVSSSNASTAPTTDLITKWEAPITGLARVKGILQRPSDHVGGNGMTATLYLNRGTTQTLLWQHDVGANDTAACTPSFTSGSVGTGCDSTGAGSWLSLQKGDRLYSRLNAKGDTAQDIANWNLAVEYDGTPAEYLNAREAWGPYLYRFSEDHDQRAMGAFAAPWVASADGTVQVDLQVDKSSTADSVWVGMVVRSPDGSNWPKAGTTVVGERYSSTQTSSAAPTSGTVNVKAGDEIYAMILSDTPIDPETVLILGTVSYTNFCRFDTTTGRRYCGSPQCNPVDASKPNGATDCTIAPDDNADGILEADPLAQLPVPGSVINQAVPAYYQLHKWIVQAKPNVPGSDIQTIDRRVPTIPEFAPTSAKVCVANPNNANAGAKVRILVQGVNRKHVEWSAPIPAASQGAVCYTTPLSGVTVGQQVIFSVYAPSPLDPSITFLPSLNGQLLTGNNSVDIYYPDPNAPTIDRFPNVGQSAPMVGGFHGFYTGTWNGNLPFDETKIKVPSDNDSYLPGSIGIQPAAPPPPGTLSFGWGTLLALAPAVVLGPGAVLAAASDPAVGTVISGVVGWKSTKVLLDLGGKGFAFGLCESSPMIRRINGMQYTEIHSKTTGIIAGPVAVATTAGASVSGLDLLDINGDRYPDQVSTAGVRYLTYPASSDPSTSAGTFGPAVPTVKIPGTGNSVGTLRLSTNNTYSVSMAGGSGFKGDAQSADSTGKANGVQFGWNIADHVSQGFDRLSRDLRDINGDGLPDLVEVIASANNPHPDAALYRLQVRLNYGYGFGNPITWDSAPWTNAAAKPPANLYNVASNPSGSAFVRNTLNALDLEGANRERDLSGVIRLEETGHKGFAVGLSATGGIIGGSAMRGTDDSYVRTFVDLVDVNGDGMPDQVTKFPGDAYRIKLNTGTGFGPEKTSQALPWSPSTPPVLNVTLLPVSVASVDALGFRRASDTNFGVNVSIYVVFQGGGMYGTGGMASVIDLVDINGDGLLDQVLKNADTSSSVAPFNAEVQARLNQSGQANLLSTVALPLGGSIALQYSTSGNWVGTQSTALGSLEIDAPLGRIVLSKVTVDDGRGATSQNPGIDTIDYGIDVGAGSPGTPKHLPSSFHDRAEREDLGFAQVTVTHGVGTFPNFTNGDGSKKVLYFLNQNYGSSGRLLAEYDIGLGTTGTPIALRGSVTIPTFGATPGSSTARTLTSTFASYVDSYDVVFNGTVSLATLLSQDPRNVTAWPAVAADGSLIRRSYKTYDTKGNLTYFADFGDRALTVDDVAFTVNSATFSGTHFTAVDSITATPYADTATTLQKRTLSFKTQNGHPTLEKVSDLIFRGNQPGTTTAWTGQASTSTFQFNDADFGGVGFYTDPTGYKVTYGYDATKTYVTNITDSFGYKSSSTPNLDFGLPATTTDVNGKVVTYNYDAFGRLSKVWGPTDPTSGTATIQMTYTQGASTAPTFPRSATTKHKDTSGTIDTVTFDDGLGRAIETKKESERFAAGAKTTGFIVSGAVVYDARGRVISQDLPSFSTAASSSFVEQPLLNPTVYTYDGLGRQTLKEVPDERGQRLTRAIYATAKPGASTSLPGATGTNEVGLVIDPNGHPRWTYRDGAGRVAGVRETNTIRDTAGVSLITKYAYDGLGNLATVTDAKSNKTTATYDSLSRLVTLASPDAGTVQYRYALNGNLAEKVTAANAVIKYGYDVNRLKTITYPTSSMNVTYVYGLPTETGDTAGNVASRIKSVTMEGGTEARTYDAFGNVNQTVTTLSQLAGTAAAPAATMKYSYDWLGRIQKMTFPKVVGSNWTVPTGDGEVVTYSYDNGGLLKKIASSSDTYLADVGYDEFGRVMEKAGNNVVTNYTYDQSEGWLLTATATANPSTGPAPFMAMTYEHDLGGNIKKVMNEPTSIAADTSVVGYGPMSIIYEYDEQDQLKSANARYRGHKTWGYRYESTFDYDEIGNMISKSQKDLRLNFKAADTNLNQGTDGAVQPTTTYTLVPAFSSTRPHQATSVEETASNGSRQLRPATFDANGNKTTDVVGPATRTLTWDEENRLKTVADKVGTATATIGTYRYNPEGERTQRLGSNGRTTFYVNPYVVITDDLVMMKHIFAGDRRVAVKMESTINTTPTRLFYHSDNVGSASYITDKNQNLIEHDRYFPFGESWTDSSRAEHIDSTGAGASDHRDWLFTGKELDTATGYHYFGARYYDAKASTWLSPDPILATYMRGEVNGGAFQPKNLSTYSYSWANPIALRDPDGKSPALAVVLACATNPACVGAAVTLLGIGLVASRMAQNAPPLRPFVNVPPSVPTAVLPPSEARGPVGAMSLPGAPVSESGPTILSTPAEPARGASILRAEAGGGAKVENLSEADQRRIQAVADKLDKPVTAVGSRVAGTAGANSDYDYVIPGATSRERHTARRYLPRGPGGGGQAAGGSESGIDVLRGPVDKSRPHITFTPNRATPNPARPNPATPRQ